MNTLIITNNPKVNIIFSNTMNVEFFPEADQEEILRIARDRVHLGAKLIIHPMMGRIKPHETPYKSIFLEDRTGDLDFASFTIMEDSITQTQKYLTNTFMKKYDDNLLSDLQFLDYTLILNGIEEYRR